VIPGQDNQVLRDYTLPQASNITSSIKNPIVKANNFELSPVHYLRRAGPVRWTSLGQPQCTSSQVPCEIWHHQA